MSIESESVIIGIVVGSLIAAAFVLALVYYVLRLWIRGPMKGSDNRRRLDGRIVVITGKSQTNLQWLSLLHQNTSDAQLKCDNREFFAIQKVVGLNLVPARIFLRNFRSIPPADSS